MAPICVEIILPSVSIKYEVGIDEIPYCVATLWSESNSTLKLYLFSSINGFTVFEFSPMSTANITRSLSLVS